MSEWLKAVERLRMHQVQQIFSDRIPALSMQEEVDLRFSSRGLDVLAGKKWSQGGRGFQVKRIVFGLVLCIDHERLSGPSWSER